MAPSFDPSQFDEVLNSHKIVIFTLSYCPYCKKAKEYLNEKGVSYYNVELDSLDNQPMISSFLKYKTGSSKYPKTYINGQLVGGLKRLKTFGESE